MKLLIQIARNASVTVDQEVIGAIPYGYLVLIGIEESDTQEIADRMIHKMMGLRIFPDDAGKTNLDLSAVNGSLLLVSQFTLYANCKKGNRPSFVDAAKPEYAERLYEYITEKCKSYSVTVATGRFGADMKVSFTNEGPFTVMLDSHEILGTIYSLN